MACTTTFARFAGCLATALAATTVAAQTYQPAAPAPSATYPTQPAVYQAQPATYPAQPAARPAPAGAYSAQPAAMQPGTYGAQPRGNAQPAASYQSPGAVTQPLPRAGVYSRTPGQAAAAPGSIRPVQFEQPIPAQQAPAQQQPPASNQQASAAAVAGGLQPAAQPAPAASDSPGFQPGGATAPLPSTVPAQVLATQNPGEHPLLPALRWAKQGYEGADKLQDYSCTLVKRERIDGVLGEHEYMFVKVRHRPFSVYTYFLGPAKVKGQEAVYVEGQNDGSLLAHGNGVKHRLIGTVALKPTSTLAMNNNRYPITEMGMRRLLERLLEVGTNDVKYGECKVNWIQGAKVNNRVCTCIQVEHPVPRRNFLFSLARIYVDDELQLPIRYEAYEWPARQGDPQQLTEEYTFLNVKVNNGFTDLDFSVENPKYGFR